VPVSKKNKSKPLVQNYQSQVYAGTQELRDSEVALIRYSTEIVRKFFSKMDLQKKIVEKRGDLLDFGAGTGFLAEIFHSRFQIKPDCVEIDPSLLKLIEQKKFRCFQFLSQTPQDYAAIYTSNVLEHIDDDSAILKKLFDSLKPGGIIGIYVPAHPILYSAMDKEIGHVRRYTRSELRKKVLAAGFSIQSITYDEFIGFFASALVKFIGYKNQASLGSQKSLLFYDKIIYPASRIFDAFGFRYILGKNLILVACKPER